MARSRNAGEILFDVWRLSQEHQSASIYDEVLREVSQRAAEQRSIGKADIGALVVWKRLNASTTWATKLMQTPDATVREATGRAWLMVNDETVPVPEAGGTARGMLRDVPGMGGTGAVASAVLVALSPHRMAVWDRRVGKTLTAMGRSPKRGNGKYASYLQTTLELAEDMREASGAWRSFTPRDVDLALFHAAKDKDALAQLKL